MRDARLKISLCKATSADAAKVFKWRNDPEIRGRSVNTQAITWLEHEAWFKKVLADPNWHLFIAVADGSDVGVIRFDVDGNEAEVHIYVVPGLTGRGYGTGVLDEGIRWAESYLLVGRLTARVSAENEASIKLFTRAGFTIESRTKEWLFFKKELAREA